MPTSGIGTAPHRAGRRLGTNSIRPGTLQTGGASGRISVPRSSTEPACSGCRRQPERPNAPSQADQLPQGLRCRRQSRAQRLARTVNHSPECRQNRVPMSPECRYRDFAPECADRRRFVLDERLPDLRSRRNISVQCRQSRAHRLNAPARPALARRQTPRLACW